jgi:hypothetical protein
MSAIDETVTHIARLLAGTKYFGRGQDHPIAPSLTDFAKEKPTQELEHALVPAKQSQK